MNNDTVTVVIPTLQKNKAVLYNLIDILSEDNTVEEIIVIDNSLEGIELHNPKLNIITPNTNMYVNPSWNMGVKMAKSKIVALFNDDISIPKSFCSNIIQQMKPDMGIIGISSDSILAIDDFSGNPQNTNPVVIRTNYMDNYYGIALFFYKQIYIQIPDEMKIVYGDVWLFNNLQKSGKQNYKITNQILYHIGSLSSGDKKYNKICKNDAKIFKKLYVKWYHRIFSKEETWYGWKFRILGITFVIKKKNTRRYCNE